MSELSDFEGQGEGVLGLMANEILRLEMNRQMAREAFKLYSHEQEPEIAVRAIDCMKIIMDAGWASTDDINAYSMHMYERYERAGKLQDLELAITHLMAALDAIPGDSPDGAPMLNNLGIYLSSKYTQTGNLDDLEAAITCFETAMEAAPDENPHRGSMLSNLGSCLKRRYKRTENLSDLEAAIKSLETAIGATPAENYLNRANIVSLLADNLMSKYERTGDLTYLEAAIQHSQAAIEATPDNLWMLSNLGDYLSSRYTHTGHVGDLEAAIKCSETVMNGTPENHSNRAIVLNNLATHLHLKYERTGDLDCLEAAIQHSKAAIEATPGDGPGRAWKLDNLGSQLRSRYAHMGRVDDLEAAIKCSETAMNGTPENHPNRANILNNLATHLHLKYERTGDFNYLEAAIKHSKAAIEATPSDGPGLAWKLDNLGSQLSSRYAHTGSLDDLRAAIKHSETAIEATPESHVNRTTLLGNLATHLHSQYQRSGSLEDLEAAIKCSQAIIETLPIHHTDRAKILSNLANYLSSRYNRTGNLEDIEAAIRCSEAAIKAIEAIPENHLRQDVPEEYTTKRSEAISSNYKKETEVSVEGVGSMTAITPENHQDKAKMLCILARHLSSRYQRTGNLADLEAAICRTKAAIGGIPHDHPDRAWILNNLGNYLSIRYQRTGNMQDLEAAIVSSEAAINTLPETHSNRMTALSNLGNHLNSQYQQIGNIHDLKAAIQYSKAAIGATQEDQPNRGIILLNLGCQLSSRYKRTKNLVDLEMAIECSITAMDAIPENHPDQAKILNNLAHDLSSQYQLTGDVKNLEAAITHVKISLERTPENHPDRAGRLHNLGNYLSEIYERSTNLQDMEASVHYGQAAIKATPEGDPNLAGRLYSLGKNLQRFSEMVNEASRSIQGFQQSLAAFQASWGCRNGLLLIRLQSAFTASKLLVSNRWVKDLNQACTLLHDAVHQMPLVTSRSLERDDQQHILRQLTDLASFAAAVSLEAGQSPFEALSLLELGRSVTNSQLLDYRSDISDLEEQHPSLAESFHSLRKELDSPFTSTQESFETLSEPLQIQQAAIRRRNRIAQKLDDILLDIREHQGFENFLRPLTKECLLSAAEQGPIVVLNATDLRSDAILLTQEKITSIPLPELSGTLVKKYLGTAGLAGLELEGNGKMRKLLTWLWRAAVEPVLQALDMCHDLGEGTAPSETTPRVWWIGVGLMAKAPIHAAGEYIRARLQHKRSALQFSIPSYTPTIKALIYSRSRRQSQHNAQEENMLIVAMPTTPGAAPLTWTAQETNNIRKSVNCKVHTLIQPTTEAVLEKLLDYSIVHFACHGVSTVNPANSHLLLQKTSLTDDGIYTAEVDRLCVKDIAATKLSLARLAYLSACSTADNIDSELADEVTHIASSFLIAGFKNVIGALWTTEDEACNQMAADFYDSLRVTDNLAMAYRNAVLKLRASKPTQPLYWAPFIHLGA